MSASRWMRLTLLVLLVPFTNGAETALSVTPSTNWYGDDGSWSAVSIRVGSPAQWLDVLVNTQSSETWVVGIGGCNNNNSLCTSSRGGTFDSTKSSTWRPLGFFDLGVNQVLGNTGYADYGLDSLVFGSTGVNLASTIIGIVNATGLTWLGSFGLGTVPGNFNNESPLSAISALVEKEGVIPSHSYGYTAGARYQQKGVPNSLTLGGYDANRFIPHNISFSLNPSQQPQSYIDSVSVVSSATSNNWTHPIQLLSSADRVSAIIDSSTPYLWFPRFVCDQFAAALGLSYNSSLNLYTFDNRESQRQVLQNAQLTFTFGLSDLSSSAGVANITLPYEAFDLQLTYPAVPNSTYGSEDSTKYYFPLRQATNEAQYRIGRAFLQEAYLITNYESNSFSVHQAVHTSDPIANISIVAIPRDGSTPLSGPPSTGSGKKLSHGAIVGIVVGAAVAAAILSFVTFWVCRRRKQPSENSDDEKPSPTQPRTMLDRLLRRGRSPPLHEASGNTNYPTEVGADASHERFEMPAPLGPAELDSESGTLDGTTENGSIQDSANMSAYERVRRKIERQQAAAANAARMVDTLPAEKTENDTSQVAHYRAPEFPDLNTPLVSPIGAESGGSLSMGQPSPVSPSFPTHSAGAPPTYRRINPANVVYAGRLPDDVQLPSHVPKVIGRDGRTIRCEGSVPGVSSPTDPGASGFLGSLGSQYTDNQEADMGDFYGSGGGNTHSAVSPISNETGSGSGSGNGAREPRGDAQLRELSDPMVNRRRLDGEDFIHVPQPAENRFSWEEERI